MSMQVTVLNGAANSGNLGERLAKLLTEELANQAATEVVPLGAEAIDSCSGCFGCWTRTPGQCWKEDTGRQLAGQAVRSDLLVFLTPVTFGGYSADLKKAVDRMIPLLSPYHLRVTGEVQGKGLPRLLAVGWMDGSDVEAVRLFSRLVERNGQTFHAPAAVAEVVDGRADDGELRGRLQAALRKVQVTS